MQRRMSFYALLITAVLAGVLFFRVMQPFLMPLLLGAVLSLLFRPFHEWCVQRLGGRRPIAAAFVTFCIFILCLVPLTASLILVTQQLLTAGNELMAVDWHRQPVVADTLKFISRYVPEEHWKTWSQPSDGAVESITMVLYERTLSLLVNIVGFIVGLSIVLLSVYYFLSEGPALVRAVQRVSPFKNEDEMQLFQEFDRVCRGVILASVVCALAQAVLAGIGFALLGVPNMWLLSGLTMFTSMIPFVGAAVVWIGVTIWLISQGEYGSATFLAIYGTVVISTFDNVIRAYVLHGSARLHPLIALISVLGAMQTMGLWGVFIGPLIAAFFYTLLKILHQRMRVLDGATELIKPEELTSGVS